MITVSILQASFKTPDEAYEAACAFALSAHGKFYNPGKIG